MGERKVLNKYYPADFDPAKIPRRRQPKNKQMKVRSMLPMSVRCKTCGEYMYKGTKFNSRKEDVIGDKYLDMIQTYRLYSKCTRCSAEITYKTDPQSSDYVVESGASRNFEPWRDEDESAAKEKRKRDEVAGDAMKSLENRTLDSKRERDILAALDEMKSMKSRQASVSVDAMLEALQRRAVDERKKLEEEDEALVKSVDFRRCQDDYYVRRINDEELDDDDVGRLNNGVKRQKGSQEEPIQPTQANVVKFVVVSKKSNPSAKKEQQQGSVQTSKRSSVFLSYKRK